MGVRDRSAGLVQAVFQQPYISVECPTLLQVIPELLPQLGLQGKVLLGLRFLRAQLAYGRVQPLDACCLLIVVIAHGLPLTSIGLFQLARIVSTYGEGNDNYEQQEKPYWGLRHDRPLVAAHQPDATEPFRSFIDHIWPKGHS